MLVRCGWRRCRRWNNSRCSKLHNLKVKKGARIVRPFAYLAVRFVTDLRRNSAD